MIGVIYQKVNSIRNYYLLVYQIKKGQTNAFSFRFSTIILNILAVIFILLFTLFTIFSAQFIYSILDGANDHCLLVTIYLFQLLAVVELLIGNHNNWHRRSRCILFCLYSIYIFFHFDWNLFFMNQLQSTIFTSI